MTNKYFEDYIISYNSPCIINILHWYLDIVKSHNQIFTKNIYMFNQIQRIISLKYVIRMANLEEISPKL